MTHPNTRPTSLSPRLQRAVLGLGGVRTASVPLPAVLLDVLGWITVALPADSCSILLRTAGTDDLVCGSDETVETLTLDAVTRMPSPLSDALTSGSTTTVGRLPVDPRWPVFGRHADGLGVHGVLTGGMLLDERTSAVVAFWATTADAFTPGDGVDVLRLASHLAPVLRNAVAAHDLLRRNENLAYALTSRAVIDQAIGIVMSRTGSTSEQAFDRIRAISQREHVKVHEVAQRMVRDAVNRSRARLSATS